MVKILGIKIIDRIKEAGFTQNILTKHASVITTRLGFHEVTDAVCSREAYVILHINDQNANSGILVHELKSIGGIEVREISFDDEEQPALSGKEGVNLEILCLLVERDTDVILTVQKVLTSFGCNIRTRLGVNETFFGRPAGLIILELTGGQEQRLLLEGDLKKIKKVHVRSMSF